MTKQDRKQERLENKIPLFLIKRLCEGSFILLLTVGIFILLSLFTYNPQDSSALSNAGGKIGAMVAHVLYLILGYVSYFFPLCVIFLGWLVLQGQRNLKKLNRFEFIFRSLGLIFFLAGASSFLSLEPGISAIDGSQSAGGLLGNSIANIFHKGLSLEGATLLISAITLIGITLFTGVSWINVIEGLGLYTLAGFRFLGQNFQKLSKLSTFIKKLKPNVNKRARQQTPKIIETAPSLPSLFHERPASVPVKEAIKQAVVENDKKPVNPPLAETMVVVTPAATIPKPVQTRKVYVAGLPSLELLDKGEPGKALGGYTHQELENMSRKVEQHLLDFGIHADVVAVHPGPVITRFELQLAAGIKVSRLTTLSKDLARSLSVFSVRVVEVIPGKTVVGLELPNQHREMVRLSEVLIADVYQQAISPLTIALGVDIAGHPMVVDLAKMPHLLVAGTTGSGKSVGINAIILSLLFRAKPDQLRLIMIDPKMLELSIYDGIPHLLTPVVTDMKEAASALRWCVAEMEKRYKLMSALGVRNLAGYNIKVNEAQADGQPISDPLWKIIPGEKAPELEALPYIVVIIDELADMMMVVGKKVEQLIARIAQKARAAGIHLILATQRPSVDVLTGLIKSNIPTRISFQVSSKIDSRTILDQQGAEQLLGHGDMLYLAPGTGAPLRVHGAFVDDKEVHRLANDWRERGEPAYIEEITQIQQDSFDGNSHDEDKEVEEADPLYDEAVEFVLHTRKASISSVQRKFKIGYNRAARLIEEMERTGIVGPLEGSFRDVLVSDKEE